MNATTREMLKYAAFLFTGAVGVAIGAWLYTDQSGSIRGWAAVAFVAGVLGGFGFLCFLAFLLAYGQPEDKL